MSWKPKRVAKSKKNLNELKTLKGGSIQERMKNWIWVENPKGWLSPRKNDQYDMSWKSEVVVLREMTRVENWKGKLERRRLENGSEKDPSKTQFLQGKGRAEA